eukprot:symbB.v1.2.011793.t1/scaffold773.1/size166002/2
MYKVKVSKPVTHCMTQSTSEAKSKLKMSNLLNSSMMMRSQGIRFGCTACGRCCVRRVPAASAPLAESEIQSMAQALGLSSVCFKGKYTESLESANMKGRQLKVDPVSGRCMLLTESGKCSVHDARPAACRTYPFWPENVASPYEWAREAVLCEGIESTWAQPAPSEKRDEVPARSVEDELLVEELRVAGYLYQENWTHSEAMEYIEELREAGILRHAGLDLHYWVQLSS